MRIINLYIGKAILTSTLLVWFVFVGLSVLFTFLAELRVTNDNYTAYIAFLYSILITPQFAIKVFPLSLLVGSVFCLSKLSHQSELTVIFASGISIKKILSRVLLIGLVLLSLVIVFSETVMPKAELYARNLLNISMDKSWFKSTKYGVWMLQKNYFLHISTMKTPQNAENLSIFYYDGLELTKITNAKRAYLQENGVWLLFEVTTTDFIDDNLVKSFQTKTSINSNIPSSIITKIHLSLDKLSSLDLITQRQFLLANNLKVDEVEQELWRRISFPFSALVMVFFAFPLTLKSNRITPLSQKTFYGIMLGILFFIFSQVFERLGLVLALPTWFNIWTPIILFLLIGIKIYRKI